MNNVRERNEPGFLERPSGCRIRRVATRAGNGAEFVAQSLQFLDEVRAQAAPPKRLSHFHVDVTIRPVVVEQDAALRSNRPIQFQEPFAAALPSLQTNPYLFL